LEQQVRIHLQTVIEDNGQKETNSSKQNGMFYRKDKMDVITFEETTEDNQLIKSFITIHPEKVNIKRSGIISMNQQFRMEKVTENVYTHPHGNIHMETYTNSLFYQAMDSQQEGQLIINYTVKLNGQEERKHKLTLTINKEDV
jgi:uncharacterized beta-barrel protein YwiB (DUF1934 family)